MDAQSSDDDDEFIEVNNSGFMLNKTIYDNLYDHQKEGVAFLYGLHRDGKKGGVLADDMGLGKTIQVISFLCGMYDSDLMQHCMLVMPTTLITNWVREFEKWVPGMRVREYHGTSKVIRSKNLRKIQIKGGVLVTSYQMVLNNWELLSSIDGKEFFWDYVILDEAHKIKTSSTKTAKSVHAVLAKHRVLLTGTPVQNNLREMWSLFDFACQGSLLGTYKTFKTQYENPITRAREKDATPGEKVLGLKMSENLMNIISPYFLRRTKADVQKDDKDDKNVEDQPSPTSSNGHGGLEVPSLPEKNDLIVWTYLSPVQEEIYRMFISLDHIKEVLMTTRSPLAELTILKKLCDHPRLLSDKAARELGLSGAPDSALQENENHTSASSIDSVPDDTLISESGKLEFLIELLERLREEGNRTLVFSRSVKMLNIIQRILKNRGFKMVRIDGTVTDLAEREKRIGCFQSDPSYAVFLLTTQVGGVGLTLTSANRVVIFDPSWNPATDAQAVDRAYRIGQTRNVIVYRLITCGTVEEKIYRRQVFKDSLIRQTTGDNKNPFRYFSKQELKELFRLENTRSSTTQLQLQELHSKEQSSDPDLMRHIEYLYTRNMFGVSHHDLLFCVHTTEEDVEGEEEHEYIEKRVLNAENLMKVESQIQRDLKNFELEHTEPRSLLQPPVRTGRQGSGSHRHEDHEEPKSPTFQRPEEEPIVLDETLSPNTSVTNANEFELDSSRTDEVETLQGNSRMRDVTSVTNGNTFKLDSSRTDEVKTLQGNSRMDDANDVISVDDDADVSAEDPGDHVLFKEEENVCEAKVDSFTDAVEEDEDDEGRKKSIGTNDISFQGQSSFATNNPISTVDNEVEEVEVSREYTEDQLVDEEEDHVITRKKKTYIIHSSEDEEDDDDDNDMSVRVEETAPILESSRVSNMNEHLDGPGDTEEPLDDVEDEDDGSVRKKKGGFIISSSEDEGDDEEEVESKTDSVSMQRNFRLDETNDEADMAEYSRDRLLSSEEHDISSAENKSAFLTYSSEEEEEDVKGEDKHSSKTATSTSSQGSSRLTDSNVTASGDDYVNMSAENMESQLESDREDSIIVTKKKRAFVSYSSEEEGGDDDDDDDDDDDHHHNDGNGRKESFNVSSSFLSMSGAMNRSCTSVASRHSLVDNLMEKFEDILMDEDESSEEMVESDQENMFNGLDDSDLPSNLP
ncbi:hypothetical protein ACEWY4_009975 [Coilia grayii]|uniref:DNA excision repair protein ERCC-6-like n=1 Tax=Coilia grayii TaxID=363190 RepID=A0ABD1K840_9TELE